MCSDSPKYATALFQLAFSFQFKFKVVKHTVLYRFKFLNYIAVLFLCIYIYIYLKCQRRHEEDLRRKATAMIELNASRSTTNLLRCFKGIHDQ